MGGGEAGRKDLSDPNCFNRKDLSLSFPQPPFASLWLKSTSGNKSKVDPILPDAGLRSGVSVWLHLLKVGN